MRDLNFLDVASVAEAEFLVPRHRHAQHRLLVVERNECLIQQWLESSDIRDTEDLYAMKREERRADRRRRRD
jgi:hypothetical protein